MPRDATGTREELIRAATRLLARRGIHGLTVRELHEAAGQRNASALQYHFGSRDGLLRAIVERHQEPIDAARASWLERATDLRGHVEALVEPLAESLRTQAGRDYLQIIAQVMAEAGLRDPLPAGPPNARRCVEVMVDSLDDLPEDVRITRVANVVLFVTDALAHRARRVDARRAPLEHEAFVADLVTSVVGALTARADRTMHRARQQREALPRP